MPTIDLRYGPTAIPFEYDADRFAVLGGDGAEPRPALNDAAAGERLEQPLGAPPLEEIAGPGETVLIVVPDATREAAAGQVVNLLVRRLIAAGVMPYDIGVIFATGIHRRVTERERGEILTPFIAQRVKTYDHNARDLMQLVRLGETADGIPVELNRKLTEFDHVVIVGAITFHYFAGFTGGRKLICPGLASSRTISGTHRLAFDCEKLDRRAGVGPGRLEGNPVHEAFVEIVERMPPAFAVNTIVSERGELLDLVCGDWRVSHAEACRRYAADHTLAIPEKRDLVVVSCGGAPFDLNLIQAHKALEAASQACRPGGTICFLAECANGLGREDFLEWFAAGDSREMAERLCERYQVNGQTAWSLLRKAERFDIRIKTGLVEEVCAKMRLEKIDALPSPPAGATGYILPYGAKYDLRPTRA